jgi:hypothetical protein
MAYPCALFLFFTNPGSPKDRLINLSDSLNTNLRELYITHYDVVHGKDPFGADSEYTKLTFGSCASLAKMLESSTLICTRRMLRRRRFS